jgi:hypothetical protein
MPGDELRSKPSFSPLVRKIVLKHARRLRVPKPLDLLASSAPRPAATAVSYQIDGISHCAE